MSVITGLTWIRVSRTRLSLHVVEASDKDDLKGTVGAVRHP